MAKAIPMTAGVEGESKTRAIPWAALKEWGKHLYLWVIPVWVCLWVGVWIGEGIQATRAEREVARAVVTQRLVHDGKVYVVQENLLENSKKEGR